MLKSKWRICRLILIPVLIFVFSLLPAFSAPDHVVSPARLQQEAAAATAAREQNVRTVTEFLSSPAAVKAFESSPIKLMKVKDAVASLSDEEVAQLAARAEKAQSDFAAGTLSNSDLIIVTLGVVILIAIIVAAR
jgi:hypothetical protein